MPGTVLYERDGHIATITYNRPEAMNAVNAELRGDLNAAWTTFRDDEEAAVRATKEVAKRGLQLPFGDAIRFGETIRLWRAPPTTHARA